MKKHGLLFKYIQKGEILCRKLGQHPAKVAVMLFGTRQLRNKDQYNKKGEGKMKRVIISAILVFALVLPGAMIGYGKEAPPELNPTSAPKKIA